LLVTGASRGIGAATALAGAQAGFRVAVHFGVHGDEAEAVCAEIREMGGTAVAVQADMGNEAEIVRLFQAVDAALGPVTALVNNAGGVFGVRAIGDTDTALVERTLAVNLPDRSFAAARRCAGCRRNGAVVVGRLSIYLQWRPCWADCRKK